MTENIAIIGSTGSIGRQTLEVIAANRRRFKVAALACNENISLLEEQILFFKPEIAAVFDAGRADALRHKLSGRKGFKTRILSGENGLVETVSDKAVTKVVFASSGTEALPALIAAIKKRKKIAIANKEMIVAAGGLVMKLAKKYGVTLVPIDSEHSAIFQCIEGENPQDVEKIILTCSGGPFYGKNLGELKKATLEQALEHPVWKMGENITLDSATLMNKAFEVIEAMHLFGLPASKIEVLIHPQCIVHSLVQFGDGSVKAILSPPDMKHPIAYALSWPGRLKTSYHRLDLSSIGRLTFSRPDPAFRKGLDLAYEAATRGGNLPAGLVYANQMARNKLISGEITFTGFYPYLQKIFRGIRYASAVSPELLAMIAKS